MPIRGPLQARILFCKPTSENSEACVGHVFCRAHGVAHVVELLSSFCQHNLSSRPRGGWGSRLRFPPCGPGTHPAIRTPPKPNLNYFALPIPFPSTKILLSVFAFVRVERFSSRLDLNNTEFHRRTREHTSLGYSGN